MSVVIPAHEAAAATLGHVLDALAVVQDVKVEVVVVDDGSHDLTSRTAARHWSCPTVLRLPRRAADGLVLLGLHHNQAVPVSVDVDRLSSDPVSLPAEVVAGAPDAMEDPRVYWRGEPGFYPYSGLVLPGAVRVALLERTADLRELGYGRWVYDFDLPSTADAKLLSLRRREFMAVGGFAPEFGSGWGMRTPSSARP